MVTLCRTASLVILIYNVVVLFSLRLMLTARNCGLSQRDIVNLTVILFQNEIVSVNCAARW